MNYRYDAELTRQLRCVGLALLIASGVFLCPAAVAQEKATAKAKAAEADPKAPPQPPAQSDAEKDGEEKGDGEADAPPTMAIVGADIHTQTGRGVIAGGTILISNDKIVAVGDGDLQIPDGVETVDGAGLNITPGLIDSHSRLWLTSSAASATASDGSLKVLDGVDPFDEQWNEVIRHGVTSVYVQPGSRGTLGGFGAVLSVVPGELGPEVHCELASLQASLGIGATTNLTRNQQYERTKKALQAAVDYQKKVDAYAAYMKKQEAEKKKAAAKSNSTKKPASKSSTKSDAKTEATAKKPTTDPRAKASSKPSSSSSTAKSASEKKEKAPEKPDVDKKKARLAKVVAGKIPLRLEINSSDDAYYAQKLLKDFKDLQVIFTGLGDLRSAKADVVDLNAPMILGPWVETESSYRSQPDSCDQWAELLDDYEGAIVVASNGTNSRSSRLLRAHAAQAVASGLDHATALASITSTAARVLGVGDKIGSVKAGTRADLVAFAGDPLDSSAPIVWVISGGKIVHQDSKESHSHGAYSVAAETDVSMPRAGKIAIKTNNFLLPSGKVASRVVVINRKRGTMTATKPGEFKAGKGTKVVDVGDAWITPGLFSAHSTLGLNQLVDPRLSDSSYVVAGDAISPGFTREDDLVETGLLKVLLSPSDRNTLSGSSSLVRLGAKEQVAESIAALKFSMTASARTTDRFPSSLAGQAQLIKESLDGKLLDTRLYIPEAVQEQLAQQRLQRLKSASDGKTLTIISVSSDAEIRAALDLVEQRKLKAALVGPAQLAPFADRIAELGVSVIARPITSTDYDWYTADLAAASEAGVEITFSGERAQQLRLSAALAVQSGMPTQRALASLCYGPASLTVETNNADLVIWTGSPLNLSSKILSIMVDGNVVTSDAN